MNHNHNQCQWYVGRSKFSGFQLADIIPDGLNDGIHEEENDNNFLIQWNSWVVSHMSAFNYICL